MNDKHQGPHCAGSCEGAAYNIEIQRLRAENRVLREALKDALSGLRYIRQSYGDLYGVGWDRVDEQGRKALAAHDRGEK